jgi:hypothetical protein
MCSKKALLKTVNPIVHLNSLGGREKQRFDHLRETKDLAAAWPPETMTVATQHRVTDAGRRRIGEDRTRSSCGAWGAVELHAVPAGRDRTSLPSVSDARRKFGGARDLFVVFCQEKPPLATSMGPQ